MTGSATAALLRAPYDMVGGAEVVRGVVDRFYDLMDRDDRYADLRALHARDLAPMRDSLAGFLNAWLGGPRDWFTERPGACIMFAHRKIDISRNTADQWIDAMSQAISEAGLDAHLAQRMTEALAGMAGAMAR